MPRQTPSDSTQQELLFAAIEHFALQGYAGASTRSIATAAGKPMSAITYHFGGKHDLYLAAAHYVSAQINKVFEQARHDFSVLTTSAPDPDTAYALLCMMQETAIEMLTEREMDIYARFIVHEQSDESEAFEIIYAELFGPLLTQISILLKMATYDRLTNTEARLRANMLIGQLFMFRLCRQTVLRTMSWDSIGKQERDMILSNARMNLNATLDNINREHIR